MNMDKTKILFWILLDALIVVAMINVIFFVMPLLGNLRDSFVSTHVITVTAQGKTTVTPDLAELSFSVISQGASPKALSTDNNTKMAAVMQFVDSQMIASSDIKTAGYDLQPNYQYDRKTGRSTIFGYTLTQMVTLKVRDLSKVADVLGGLAPLGVNQIGGVNFTFDDPEKFLAVARADAFAKVKEKAMEMASAAGASLGRVITISENGAPPVPIFYRGLSADVSMVGGGAAPSAPTIQPGSQDVTDSVTITYALR